MPAQRTGFKTAAFSMPENGAITLPVDDVIPASGTFSDDMFLEQSLGILPTIQSVYIDNSQNAVAISILFLATQQRITARPRSQGYYQVWEQTGAMNYQVIGAAGSVIDIIFSNFPCVTNTWDTTASSFSPLPYAAAYVSKNAVLAVGGTSQQLMAANAARTGFMIQNPLTAAAQNIGAAEAIYVTLDGTAAVVNGGTSYEIQPGGAFFCPATIPVGQINWNATTVGHKIIASEAS